MLKIIFLLFIMIMSIATDSQKYVTIRVKKDLLVVENDKPFSFYIIVKPASGIHVNAQPPVSVKPLEAEMIMKLKKITMLGEWLDSSKPIEIEGKVASMDSGEHEIKFIVSYTYCSEKDKWCRFGNDTISVSLKVKK